MTVSFGRRLPLTALAAAALLATSLVGTAQAAQVTGTVKTSTGTGVAGVQVSIKVGAAAAVQVTTDATGAFTAPGVDPGAATMSLTGPATANAALPQVWSIKGIAKTIAGGDVLNFSLPAVATVNMHVAQNAVPVVGAKLTHCVPTTPADPTVVLTGGGSVSATQDWTGAVTNATGDYALKVFKDATLDRVCAGFTSPDGGASTVYLVRSGMVDASADVPFKQIFIPAVVAQDGIVKNGTGTAQAGVKVAIRSSGGQIDSTYAATPAAGTFTTRTPAGDDLFVRLSSTSLKQAVVPPTNVPRAFKATFDAVAGASMTVNLPQTVTLTVHVTNPDGSPVKGALIRPLAGGFGAANPATLVTGAGVATLTQQIFGDDYTNALGNATVRLFPDTTLAGYQVIKSAGHHTQRHINVAASSLTANMTTNVTLPKL